MKGKNAFCTSKQKITKGSKISILQKIDQSIVCRYSCSIYMLYTQFCDFLHKPSNPGIPISNNIILYSLDPKHLCIKTLNQLCQFVLIKHRYQNSCPNNNLRRNKSTSAPAHLTVDTTFCGFRWKNRFIAVYLQP